MFNNNKQKMELMQNITATSKSTLKMQCLYVCNGNIKEARELYEFFASDIATLPDFDPVQPTFAENTKETVVNMMAWVKDNKETIVQMVDFVRGIFSKQNVGVMPQQPLPPIN